MTLRRFQQLALNAGTIEDFTHPGIDEVPLRK